MWRLARHLTTLFRSGSRKFIAPVPTFNLQIRGHKYVEPEYTDKLELEDCMGYKKAIPASFDEIERFLTLKFQSILKNYDFKFDSNKDLTEYGIDSFDIMEVITLCEIMYELQVENEELDKIKTVNDILDNIKKNHHYYGL